MRATVVLPVPGFPVKTQWHEMGAARSPILSRLRWMSMKLASLQTSRLTGVSPMRPSRAFSPPPVVPSWTVDASACPSSSPLPVEPWACAILPPDTWTLPERGAAPSFLTSMMAFSVSLSAGLTEPFAFATSDAHRYSSVA